MHRMYRRACAGWAASAVVLGGLACDGKPAATSSTTKATVKGTVTVNGKKAASGAVVFDGSNSSRPDATPIRGEIGKDGTYSIEAFVGSNRVSLSGAELTRQSKVLQYEKFSYDVQGGDNTFDITSPARK